MSGIKLPINDLGGDSAIHADITLAENWKDRRDAMARVLDARLNPQWAIDLSGWPFPGLAVSGFGGLVVDDAGVVSIVGPWSDTLVDASVNYVERTHAGVVSVQQTGGFTPDTHLPMYEITTAGGVVTAIVDYRTPATVLELGVALRALRPLTPAANKLAYFDGASSAALADLTAQARTFLAATTTALQRAALGLDTVVNYVGTWNATTNTPALADGAGNADEDVGNVYRVATAGTQDLGSGAITFDVGDYVILNNSKVWEKSDTTDAVASVAGKVGVVTLVANDISDATAAGKTLLTAATAAAQRTALNIDVYQIPLVLDGTTGRKAEFHIKIPGTIVGISGLGDQSGSLELDLLRCTFANFDNSAHPVAGDSICGGNEFTITTAHKGEDTTLTSWDPALAAGDVLVPVVNTISGFTRVTISILVLRA